MAVIKTAATETAGIETPCTKVCTIDPRSRLCTGCGRTLDEIAGWGGLSPDERRRIMAALPARRRRHAHDAAATDPA